jgi:hypothetical protein
MSSTGTSEPSTPFVPFDENCNRGSLLESTMLPAKPDGIPNAPDEPFAIPENAGFCCGACPPNGEEGWLCFNWEKGDAAAPAGAAFESGLRQVLVAGPAPRP